MPIQEELIPLAIVALVALLCGLVMARLRQPPVVGYIIAGVVLGPSFLGLVENEESVALLAEMGVLMLLFVVGMELSLRAFRRVWKIAIATTGLQIIGTLAVMFLIGKVMNWPPAAVLLLAFVIALSSTAVAIKMLADIGELRTPTGRIAVGILIAQDLAVVPMMLILEVAAAGEFDIMLLGRIALSVVLLAALIMWLSRRRRVNLPEPGVVKFHPDLMPVLGLAVCFGAATASGLLGLSPAYGAFLAGLTIGNSNLRTGMLETVMPIQGVLMMVFFLSVGLLIDIDLIWKNIGIILTMLLVVTVLKTVLNVGILCALRLPWTEALVTGLVLAQVGEFSFLLAGAGVRMEIIEVGDFRLVITVTALSLAISSLWLAAARRLQNATLSQTAPARQVLSLLYGREASWIARRFRRAKGHEPPMRLEPQAPRRSPVADIDADPPPGPSANPDHGSMDAR